MMKREGSVRTLEIIKECAETAGGHSFYDLCRLLDPAADAEICGEL